MVSSLCQPPGVCTQAIGYDEPRKANPMSSQSWANTSFHCWPATIYAIAKRIQWTWPDMYGEKCYVILMGGLHIEMAMLKVIGIWLDGSGWSYMMWWLRPIITPDDEQMAYEEWSKYMASEHPQFDYWHRVLDLELLFLQSFRISARTKIHFLHSISYQNHSIIITLAGSQFMSTILSPWKTTVFSTCRFSHREFSDTENYAALTRWMVSGSS